MPKAIASASPCSTGTRGGICPQRKEALALTIEQERHANTFRGQSGSYRPNTGVPDHPRVAARGGTLHGIVAVGDPLTEESALGSLLTTPLPDLATTLRRVFVLPKQEAKTMVDMRCSRVLCTFLALVFLVATPPARAHTTQHGIPAFDGSPTLVSDRSGAWDGETEARAGANLAVHTDRATVRLDQPPGNR